MRSTADIGAQSGGTPRRGLAAAGQGDVPEVVRMNGYTDE
jgi:hypothetical protein